MKIYKKMINNAPIASQFFQDPRNQSCLFCFGGKERNDAGGNHRGSNVIDDRLRVPKREESASDDEEQEEDVVVEDGQVGGLEIGDFVRLPEDTFVLLLL